MNAEKFNQQLGLKLRELRSLSQFTQDELAAKTGLSRASIANMETGRQAMSAYQAYEIATALELPNMDALYDFQGHGNLSSNSEIFRSPGLEEPQYRQVTGFMTRSIR